MAMPLFRHRPDSRAHAIAAALDTDTPRIARIRAPRGTQVGHYLIPGQRQTTTAVTAAAEVIFGGSVAKTLKRAPVQSWQKEAWTLRREIGEFRFSGDRTARGLSQCRLLLAELPEDGSRAPAPVTDGPLAELGAQMFGDHAHNQQSMRRAGQHLAFNGESNLLIRQDDSGAMRWAAHSVAELTGTGDSMKLSDGITTTALGPGDLVVRCWSPDPEMSAYADAPARAVLPVARELKGLTEHTSAQIDSRLAGAGLLIVPDSIELLAGQASTQDEGDEDGEMDEFIRALVESMTFPLQNRDSASALVPLVAKVPESVVDKVQHLTFSSPFDAMAKDMREEAIRRVALGMDSDPSVLLGLGGGNHWSAWLIAEDEVSLVISPMAATVCHALTTGWLRPVLSLPQFDGIDPTRYLVWFDASELELRPDRSADARGLHTDGILSDAVTLRENGFDVDTDTPKADEYKRRTLEKLLAAKPDFAPQILPALGIELDLPAIAAAPPGPAPAPDPAAPAPGTDPAPPDGQDRELPSTAGDPPPAAGTAPGPPGGAA